MEERGGGGGISEEGADGKASDALCEAPESSSACEGVCPRTRWGGSGGGRGGVGWITVDCAGATKFLTSFARCAKCSVDRVSAKQRSRGETVAITAVRASPPRASRRSRVSLESRYCTCVR